MQYKLNGMPAEGVKVLVASVHLSVPLIDNIPNTEKPLAELQQLLSKVNDNYRRNNNGISIPTVLAGDFNSLSIDINGLAPADVYRSIKTEGFESSYFAVEGCEPKYTTISRGPDQNRDDDFIHCIDYIFFSKGLRPSKVLRVDPVDRDFLPFPASPSDHLPIIATIDFIINN